jgi:prolyl 4-hydroxylase
MPLVAQALAFGENAALRKSGSSAHPIAMIADAHNAANQRESARAAALLTEAAAQGNGDAAFDLAWWNLQGRGIPRSLSQARRYFGRAAELGHAEARMIYLSLLASGIGGPPDWARAMQLLFQAAADGLADAAEEVRLLEAMPLTDQGDPEVVPGGMALSARPEITVFKNFVTSRECEYLIRTADPAFAPAPVGHVAGMREQVVAQIRTCDAAGFPWVAENPVIHAINRRIAAASGTASDWGEPMQILRYRPGQEFKPHRDCTEDVENQRILTMLIYLNDAYTGGETLFLKSGLKFRGDKCDALLFRNADNEGRPDMDTLHAGLPVLSGEKYVASRWIRRKRFGPSND